MSVLLTVSGVMPPDLSSQVASGRRPQADYAEMARVFGADLLDFAGARAKYPRLGTLVEKVGGPKALLAWATFRLGRSYDTVVTDGEQIGLPLAALTRLTWGKRARHLMIVHILSVPKKVRLMRWLRLASEIDLIFVYSSWQKQFIEHELGVPSASVVLTPFMVDCAFFNPTAVTPQSREAICSAGLEYRDYRTLIAAARSVSVDVIIASGSPWSKRPDLIGPGELPANVEVCTLSHFELRQLYADCKFVVVPLEPVNFQAGVTTILEAMAMGKAVICTRTPGQTDVIEHERTGLYVEPKNVEALSDAIGRLLDDPVLAERLGSAGRTWVERADVRRYAADLARYVRPSSEIGNTVDVQRDETALVAPDADQNLERH